MVLSKEELKAKIDEKISDDTIKIELLEDIEDSFKTEDSGVSQDEYEKVKKDYEDLKEKYKNRFLTKTDKEDVEEKKEENIKEVVDVKEI